MAGSETPVVSFDYAFLGDRRQNAEKEDEDEDCRSGCEIQSMLCNTGATEGHRYDGMVTQGRSEVSRLPRVCLSCDQKRSRGIIGVIT